MNEIPDKKPIRSLVIVCVEDHPKAPLLLRVAQKRAQELNADWRAVFVETPAHLKGEGALRPERVLGLLTLATQMGAEAVRIEALSVEKGVMTQLQQEAGNVSRVIIGGIEQEKILKFLRRDPLGRMVRHASQFAQVEIVPLYGQHYHQSLSERLRLIQVKPLHLVWALLAVGVASLGAMALEWLLPPALFRINDQNVGMLFIIACAFVAGRYGMLPGLVASVASFLTVNYYFTLPYNALKLSTVTDLLNMALFLSTAVLISLFTSQARGYAQRSARRELSTQALFTLYRIASEAHSRQQALEKLQTKLEHMLEMDVAFFLPPVLQPKEIEPTFPRGLIMNEADRLALEACWRDMRTTGLAAPYNPGTRWRFEPMSAPAGDIGVLGVRLRGKTQMDAWFGRLLTAIADQTATVLEHIELERSMEATRISEEREKLRSMLLSSVSHDFKTPLAGVIGALSVHRSLGKRLSEQKRDELLESALEEAQRLDNFITNILDMTRFESGNIRFRQEWHGVGEMLANVTKRLHHRLRHHHLVVHPFPAGLEVFMDINMTEQVLQNVLDNACKYTPTGTDIEISCAADKARGFVCQVRDHGAGLPAENMERIFDKYARLHKRDTQVAGTGLGLAISKAVMEAQHGSIVAGNHPEGGAVFTLTLPQWREADLPQTKGASL